MADLRVRLVFRSARPRKTFVARTLCNRCSRVGNDASFCTSGCAGSIRMGCRSSHVCAGFSVADW